MPFEMGRLAQDLAGGLVSTAPSEKELSHPELGALLDKYLKGRADVPTEARIRILRLIENMTMGRNAVGYLTESLHGAVAAAPGNSLIHTLVRLSQGAGRGDVCQYDLVVRLNST